MSQDKNSSHIAPVSFDPPTADQKKIPIRPYWYVGGTAVLVVGWVLFFLLTSVSLRVTTNIEGAQIAIRGGLAVPLANNYLVRPGSYQIVASAEGYSPIEESVQVEDSRELTLHLNPLPGHLQITVLPQEIDNVIAVLNDRQVDSGNPITIESIAAGSHQLLVDAPLHRARQIDLSIEGRDITQQLEVALEPAWAEVLLRSVPDGAMVFDEDERLLAQTPATIRLEEGLRKLRFDKQGYQSAHLEIEVVHDQNMSSELVTLLPQESMLSVTSEPSGAAVLINGEFRGETPVDLMVLPERDILLRLFKAGYAAHEQRITLPRGEDDNIHQVLRPVTGEVSISVTPADAEIWIDGKYIGKDSQQLALTTVQHEIEIRKDGYAAQKRTFLPLQNQRQILSFTLLTDEQAVWASIPASYRFAGHQMKLFRDPGTVLLGSNRREADRRANEVEWRAELTRAFYVSLHEVTNAQFKRFDSDHSSGNYARQSLDGADQPLVNITWQQAALYCNWLSQQEGLTPFYRIESGFVAGQNPEATGYRLLTEAEWAWLAKMTSSELIRIYPWGNEPEPQPVDNFAGKEIAGELTFTLEISDSYPVSAPVGKFPASSKGIFDLGGNVAEYLHDWYSAEAPPADQRTDPLGPQIGEYHVIRGGSWARGYIPQLRLAYRDYDAVGRNDVGFRIARYAR